MSKRSIRAGSTDQTIDLFIQDSSSTTGAGLTGLVFNTASLTCYYRKGATGTPTALTLVTQTVGGAHSDGGFVAVDGTNCPGQYRLDLSDTIVATAGMVTLYLHGAANMAPVLAELEIVAYDPFDAVRLGLTALPNAAAEAAGGLYTRGTGAGQIAQTSNGTVNVLLADGAHGGAAATITFERLIGLSTTSNEPCVTLTGNGSGAGIRAIGGLTGNGIHATGSNGGHGVTFGGSGPGSYGAWIVSSSDIGMQIRSFGVGTAGLTVPQGIVADITGNLSGSVGSVAGVTFGDFNTTLNSAHGAGSWATATGFSTLTQADVRTAVGLASANLDAQLGAIGTFCTFAVNVLEGDREIVTGTTPWTETVKIKGTGTVLMTKILRDVNGNGITSTSVVIGSAKDS